METHRFTESVFTDSEHEYTIVGLLHDAVDEDEDQVWSVAVLSSRHGDKVQYSVTMTGTVGEMIDEAKGWINTLEARAAGPVATATP